MEQPQEHTTPSDRCPARRPWTATAAVTRTSGRSSTSTVRQRTGRRSAAGQSRQLAGSPGPRRDAAPLSRGRHGGGVTPGAAFVRMKDRPPFIRCFIRGRPRDRSRKPLAPLRFVGRLPNRRTPPWGVGRGWERPPSDPRIYSPESRRFIRRSIRGSGSLPARACGASIPAGRRPAPPAAGPGGVRRSLRRRRGPRRGRRRVGRQLADGAHGPWALCPAVGEPEGFRGLVEGDLLRQGEVGGDHSGAPLRRARTGAGVRGLRPRPSGAPAAAREAGGSRGGAASPRQPIVYTMGMLAHLP